MAFKKHNPGCPCCDCVIFSTGFSGDDCDEFSLFDGAGYTCDGSGILSISDADVKVLANTPHPFSPYPQRLVAKVAGDDGSEIRLLLVVDEAADTGLIVEYRPGSASDPCGELRLFSWNGATETLLSGPLKVPYAEPDAQVDLGGCYDEDEEDLMGWIEFTVDGETEVRFLQSTIAWTAGESAGFGTGPTHTGTAEFDSFNLETQYYWEDGDDPYYDTPQYCDPCGGTCDWAILRAGGDANDFACQWQGDTTNWTLGASGLTTTTGASAITHRHPYPHDWKGGTWYRWHEVRCDIQADTNGRVVRLLAASDADGDNCVAVEVTFGQGTNNECGDVRLIKIVGGSVTAISPTHRIAALPKDQVVTVRLEYQNGSVVAQVGNVITQEGTDDGHVVSIVGPSPNPAVRQLRNETGGQPYGGPYVGLAVAGGSGTAEFASFKAGCDPIPRRCDMEVDEFDFDSGNWEQCPWTLVSGSWPTRALSGSDYQLNFTSAGKLLHLNPAQEEVQDKYWSSVQFEKLAVNNQSIALLWGADNAAANACKAELVRAYPTYNSYFRLYDSTGGVINTVTGAHLLDGMEIRGCVDGKALGGHLMDVAGYEIDSITTGGATGAVDGFSGMEVNPATGTITVNKLHTRRGTGTDSGEVCSRCYTECGCCYAGQLPYELLVELEGSAGTAYLGGWPPHSSCICTDLNRGYYVYPDATQSDCLRIGEYSPPSCPSTTIGLRLRCIAGYPGFVCTGWPGVGTPWYLELSLAGYAFNVIFWATSDPSEDCGEWSRKEFTACENADHYPGCTDTPMRAYISAV